MAEPMFAHLVPSISAAPAVLNRTYLTPFEWLKVKITPSITQPQRNDNPVVGHPGLVINPFLRIDTPDQR